MFLLPQEVPYCWVTGPSVHIMPRVMDTVLPIAFPLRSGLASAWCPVAWLQALACPLNLDGSDSNPLEEHGEECG